VRSLLVAVTAGLALGLLAGGRLGAAGTRPFRLLPLLVAGVAGPLAAELADLGGGPGRALVLGGQVALVAFAAANLRVVGMPVVLVGLGLNAAVLAANDAMPVRATALVEAGHDGGLEGIDLGVERRLEAPGDALTGLADIVPVRPLGEVVSFGDLILAAGVADVAFRMVLPPGARRRRAAQVAGPAGRFSVGPPPSAAA